MLRCTSAGMLAATSWYTWRATLSAPQHARPGCHLLSGVLLLLPAAGGQACVRQPCSQFLSWAGNRLQTRSSCCVTGGASCLFCPPPGPTSSPQATHIAVAVHTFPQDCPHSFPSFASITCAELLRPGSIMRRPCLLSILHDNHGPPLPRTVFCQIFGANHRRTTLQL